MTAAYVVRNGEQMLGLLAVMRRVHGVACLRKRPRQPIRQFVIVLSN